MASLDDITPGTWNLDPTHSRLGFSVRHLMVSKVRGRFDEFTAQVTASAPAKDSSVEFEVQTASVETGNADRDTHLRSADFFDAEQFPTITFRATSITDSELVGDLTLKGVTKPVTFTYAFGGMATDPWGNVRAGFEATGEIDRTDFGLSFNAPLEGGGVLVGEKVELVLDLEFVHAA